MRDIKFRALKDDMSDCNFVYGNLIYDCYGNPRIQESIETDLLFTSCFKGTESQYTGLKDRNGNEIYEGDILKEEAPRGNMYKIWRENGGLVINQFQDDFFKPFDKIQFWSGLSDMQTTSFIEGNLEIIGNIYESPELLK